MNDAFSYQIIGKAMEVHRELGPGLDERFYHALFERKLTGDRLDYLSRPRRELAYCGMVADVFEPDIVFPEKLVTELKCLTGAFAGEHFLQLICYLKFWKIRVGLLFDFGKESLSYRRIEFVEPSVPCRDLASMLTDAPTQPEHGKLLERVCAGVTGVLGEFGPGYRDTTYAGLLSAALRNSGTECVLNPVAEVQSEDGNLGQQTCRCLLVEGKFVLKVLALRRSITAADLAIVRTYLRLLGAEVGLILNFNRTSLEVRLVGIKSSKQ